MVYQFQLFSQDFRTGVPLLNRKKELSLATKDIQVYKRDNKDEFYQVIPDWNALYPKSNKIKIYIEMIVKTVDMRKHDFKTNVIEDDGN